MNKFALNATKIILNLDLHHILFFILFFLSLIQFESTITWIPETSEVFWADELKNMIGSEYYSEMTLLVRWFDLSINIEEKTNLFYVIFFLIVTTVVGIISSLILNHRNSSLMIDVKTHYLIKLSFGLALLLSYAGLNIILRVCFYVLIQEKLKLQILAGFCLIIFVIFCYLIPLFLVDEVSWRS